MLGDHLRICFPLNEAGMGALENSAPADWSTEAQGNEEITSHGEQDHFLPPLSDVEHAAAPRVAHPPLHQPIAESTCGSEIPGGSAGAPAWADTAASAAAPSPN